MSRALLDLTGQKFGRLTVLHRVPTRGRSRWACVCSCGRQHEAATDSLRQGEVRSCGCLHREASRERYRKHHAEAAAARARLDNAFGIKRERVSGYCDRPSKPLRTRVAAARDLAAALGLAAPAFRGAPRVHLLDGGHHDARP